MNAAALTGILTAITAPLTAGGVTIYLRRPARPQPSGPAGTAEDSPPPANAATLSQDWRSLNQTLVEERANVNRLHAADMRAMRQQHAEEIRELRDQWEHDAAELRQRYEDDLADARLKMAASDREIADLKERIDRLYGQLFQAGWRPQQPGL